MGLDMYLEGERFRRAMHANDDVEKYLDMEPKKLVYELGYWRKHPDLHGYIVKEFDAGVDECQEIELSVANMEQVIKAIADDELPKTSGFFFGDSVQGGYMTQASKEESIAIFKKAIAFIDAQEDGYWNSVSYCASW